MMESAGSKKLKRSRHKVIAGVLAGFAEYFYIDPIILRVLYVILSIASIGFPGIIVYLILWAVIPEDRS